MYIDSKYTIWERRYLNENATESKVLEILQKNRKDLKRGVTPVELEEMICGNDTIYDTQEPMTVHENHRDATIELYNDEQQLIWDNSNYSFVKED